MIQYQKIMGTELRTPMIQYQKIMDVLMLYLMFSL